MIGLMIIGLWIENKVGEAQTRSQHEVDIPLWITLISVFSIFQNVFLFSERLIKKGAYL